MSDQAERLRRLLAHDGATAGERPSRAASATPATITRTLLLAGGKGGAGTSNLALNLAIALAERDLRVALIDADLGRANLDLLCGLAPSRDLRDVLAGDCRLADALTDGPAGVRIVAGAHAIRSAHEAAADPHDPGASRLAGTLDTLHAQADYLLIDAGSGLDPHVATLAGAADEVIVVATPEPTALADAQAALRRLGRPDGPSLRVLVNQARSSAEAREAMDRFASDGRAYFGLVVRPLGFVPYDPRVPRAVRRRTPFALDAPTGPAARALRRIARQLLDEHDPGTAPRGGLLGTIASRWASHRHPALE